MSVLYYDHKAGAHASRPHGRCKLCKAEAERETAKRAAGTWGVYSVTYAWLEAGRELPGMGRRVLENVTREIAEERARIEAARAKRIIVFSVWDGMGNKVAEYKGEAT